MPVLLAAGYLLGPLAAGIVGFAGYIDLREFRGEIGLERALFNRAQTSLSVMAATWTFALFGVSARLAPGSMLAALVAVAVDSVVNYGMIGGVIALHDRVRPSVSLARLRMGPALSFASTYFCFGLLSLLLAEVSAEVGGWGIALFATPLILARQALSNRQKLVGAERRVSTQSRALRQASAQVVDERRDERLTVAAGLHDDVLPPLFRVHLLGQVLRQEMANGQLLAMEDDLPGLIRATGEASETVQRHIRSLRSSSLGTHGLSGTLRLLVRDLETEAPISFSSDIEELSAAPVIELLAYQVAREALRNVVRHADASSVRVSLVRDADRIQLKVEDDGRGFQPRQVDETAHFGLSLMRERIELAGGALYITSQEGVGTTLIVLLPLVSSLAGAGPES